MTTWNDIKLATLQKLFSSKGTTVTSDTSTSEYINAMPQTCNEALQMIATAGKFIIDSVSIVNRPENNLISDDIAKRNYSLANGESQSFTVLGAKSYYFTANGTMGVSISANGVLIKSITITDAKGYEAYEGNLSEVAQSDEVTITFTVSYPSNVRNIALYAGSYETDSEIPPYEDYIKYDLTKLADDFYQLDSGEIYYEGDSDPRYIAADQYYQEASRTLVLPRSMPGLYKVYYKKYPQQITLSTPADYVLPIDPEIATILPLYMASQLYKDDDNAIATVYRNEFEVAFDRLVNNRETSVPRHEEFISQTGWI